MRQCRIPYKLQSLFVVYHFLLNVQGIGPEASPFNSTHNHEMDETKTRKSSGLSNRSNKSLKIEDLEENIEIEESDSDSK